MTTLNRDRALLALAAAAVILAVVGGGVLIPLLFGGAR
jgi:hypothetical protein